MTLEDGEDYKHFIYNFRQSDCYSLTLPNCAHPYDLSMLNVSFVTCLQVVASDMVPAHDRSVIQNVTAIVNITIIDINDNAPTFSNGGFYSIT